MRLFLAGAVLVLTGCAVDAMDPYGNALQVAEAWAKLAQTPSCCRSLDEAKSVALPKQREIVSMDRDRQVFEFWGAKAYFVLFRLPEYTSPYSLRVSSRITGTPGESRVLVPRLALYDETFVATRRVDEASLRRRGNSYEHTVFFHAEQGHERYLVIYAADDASALNTTNPEISHVPIAAGGIVLTIPIGSDRKSVLRYAPTGELEIEAQHPQRTR